MSTTTAPSSGLRVERGKRSSPSRTLIYGVEKVGKSTFAAGAPSPIFLDAEDGSGHLDVPRLQFAEGSVRPRTLDEILGALRLLYVEKHEFKTLVIDTADAVEGVLWEDLCERSNWKKGIETPGYGKGYVAAVEDWRKLLHAFDSLREARGMEIIIVAHSMVKTFSNPKGEDYMRYEPKLHKGAAGLLKGWSEVILFAEFEEHATDKRKAIATGERIVHTERDAAYDAGNRLTLPPVLPLSWDAYAAARNGEGA